MAVLVQTTKQGSGSRTATVNTLTASDTFTYNKGQGQLLIFNNVTAGALTPNFLGGSAGNVSVPGYGTVSAASGYTTSSVAAGAQVLIPLDSISEFLKGGDITVTGGDAAEVILIG